MEQLPKLTILLVTLCFLPSQSQFLSTFSRCLSCNLVCILHVNSVCILACHCSLTCGCSGPICGSFCSSSTLCFSLLFPCLSLFGRHACQLLGPPLCCATILHQPLQKLRPLLKPTPHLEDCH